MVQRLGHPVHHTVLIPLVNQHAALAAAELARVATARHGASHVVLDRGRGGNGVAAKACVSILETGVTMVFGDAVADARFDGHAVGVGVDGGQERRRRFLGPVGVAAEAWVCADLLDKCRDDGSGGGVPHAEIAAAVRVLAAADFGRVAGAGGVAGVVAENGIRLQSITARTRLTVLHGRETIVIVNAVILADLECHLARGSFHHSGESRWRGLIRAAKIDPIFDNLARGWDQLY